MTTQTSKTKQKMEGILEEAADKLPIFQSGDMIEGKIVGRSGRKIWIDINGQALGIVPPSEISGQKEDLAVGKTVLSSVIKPEDDNGNVVLSLRRADKKKAFFNLKSKFEEEEALTVRVIDANRGGLIVGDENFQGFLPVSELSREHYPRVKDGDKEKILSKLKGLVDKKLTVKIISFDKNEDKLIFSEKQAVGAFDESSLKEIEPGEVVDCEITGVADFGLFVQFDNLEGLVHISEISWDRVEDIQKQFKVGDKLKAKIIEIDKEKQRISLSIKRLKDDPWKKKVKKYEVGNEIKGKITRLTPFGAFVKFKQNPNLEALIHVSEISQERINDPADVLSLGENIKAKIISIEPDEHKIGLSIKDTGEERKPVKKEKKDKSKDEAEAEEKTNKQTRQEKLAKIAGQATSKKLIKAGIKTIEDLKNTEPEKLEEINGIGAKTAKKILSEVK